MRAPAPSDREALAAPGPPRVRGPVQTPDKFRLVLNPKTARALGLNIPASMQQLADEVIE